MKKDDTENLPSELTTELMSIVQHEDQIFKTYDQKPKKSKKENVGVKIK